jgi:hypothetical protein
VFVIAILSTQQKININFLGTSDDMKANSKKSNIFRVKNFWEGFLIFESD